MLKFLDSFEHYASANLLQKWTFGGASIVPGGRNGNGLQIGAGAFVQKTLPYADEWIIGFACNLSVVSTVTSLCYIGAPAVNHTGLTLGVLTLEADATLSFYGGTTHIAGNTAGTLTLHANTWYYIEIKAKFSGSTPIQCQVDVKVNGQTVISNAGVTTGINASDLIIGSASADYFGFSGQITTGHITFDDVYVLDGTAGTTVHNNDFLGDIRILAIYPRADVTTDWTPIGPGTDHYQRVNEHIPDDDTTYIKSGNPNDIDDYLFDLVSSFTGTIPGAQFLVYARKDDEGTRSIKHTVDQSVGTFPEVFLADLYVYYHVPMDSKPGGAGWTPALFNGTAFGVKLIQ